MESIGEVNDEDTRGKATSIHDPTIDTQWLGPKPQLVDWQTRQFAQEVVEVLVKP